MLDDEGNPEQIIAFQPLEASLCIDLKQWLKICFNSVNCQDHMSLDLKQGFIVGMLAAELNYLLPKAEDAGASPVGTPVSGLCRMCLSCQFAEVQEVPLHESKYSTMELCSVIKYLKRLTMYLARAVYILECNIL